MGDKSQKDKNKDRKQKAVKDAQQDVDKKTKQDAPKSGLFDSTK